MEASQNTRASSPASSSISWPKRATMPGRAADLDLPLADVEAFRAFNE